jgi:hypothetical protein
MDQAEKKPGLLQQAIEPIKQASSNFSDMIREVS